MRVVQCDPDSGLRLGDWKDVVLPAIAVARKENGCAQVLQCCVENRTGIGGEKRASENKTCIGKKRRHGHALMTGPADEEWGTRLDL